ncbi:8201_t:CDS:2 [Ambispora gerdemannii]|uniref:8201_t:CDS:1 n=1 Tax=Ambispora gerdemannii TaxID=144530 RepID=A0A9N9AYC3_9GLOM|nr:8201_t:CDS:2 [Ambispora gerdemannii]
MESNTVNDRVARASSSASLNSSNPQRNTSRNDNNNISSSSSRSTGGGQTSTVISTVLSNAPTSTLATTSVRASAAGSRRVRWNWIGYLVENFRSASRTSKVLLILSLTMVLIQVIVTVTVLVTSRNQTCDKPLQLFLELYIVRVILACPVNVYLYLNPRENRIRGGQNQTENERRRDGWETAPAIFYLSLTWVILGYIIITIPILLCLAVIFCLPCVLVAMRILHVSETVGISGASDDVISKIPLVKYKSVAEDELSTVTISNPDTTINDSDSNTQTAPSTTDTHDLLQPHKPSRLKFGFGKKKVTSTTSSPAPPRFLTIPNKDDALCSICLSTYEDGEDLRHLWCSHHFHKDCVDKWLGLNRMCSSGERSSAPSGSQDQFSAIADNKV